MMKVVFGVCENCHSYLQVTAEHETKFRFLPNVYAFQLECPKCQTEYVHFKDKEEN
ncbi:MAG: hypothetical protein IKN12_06375 [Selenomonadaceae bacterium]|nr:hypothetical protein [Selenomonadaceae bacterium]